MNVSNQSQHAKKAHLS